MSEWISCEDELPPAGKVVLVCDYLNSFVSLGRLVDDGEDEYYFHLMYVDEVQIDSLPTHWIPLPEPPNE